MGKARVLDIIIFLQPWRRSLEPPFCRLCGLYAAYTIIPIAYRWELIPGVCSPEYHAKAAKIKYNHYTEGIIYSPYDTGEPVTEMPAASRNKMLLKQKGWGWKGQW